MPSTDMLRREECLPEKRVIVELFASRMIDGPSKQDLLRELYVEEKGYVEDGIYVQEEIVC